MNKNCLSYWFPKLEKAGLPVPRTTLVDMPREALRDVFRTFDREPMKGDGQLFFDAIKMAADATGYPCFLRTGQTSAKHYWENTCFLPNAESIPRHVTEIVEFSELAQMIGLDCSVWAVRELLPTKPLGVCPRYQNMPLCREFRFFIDNGEVQCSHPYWPLESLEQGGADISLYEQLISTVDYENALTLAQNTARAIEGAWSVDILETERGWHITDMAEARLSFHWEGCPNTCTYVSGPFPFEDACLESTDEELPAQSATFQIS